MKFYYNKNFLFIIIFILILMMLFLLTIKENFIFSFKINEKLNLFMELNLNLINSIFSITVCLISVGVFFYNKIYFNFMLSIKYKINLMIFVVSMIILINSSSFLILLLGWDGLGISSFFLVSFYSNLNSAISSLVTFFFNRLGDGFMMIFCALSLMFSTKLNIMSINFMIFMMLMMGIFTKSSQIPFGIWLPLAMTAPTPISSLVHSSTLVTSGIFILIKMNQIFFIKEIQVLLLNFGILTFLMGGLFSSSILDMKKAIAFSTLSQLGFVVISISIGNFLISLMHLIFHAFFKSSLFINLGYFMVLNFSTQDLRKINSFSNNLVLKMTFIIACLNLMGFITFSGFFSKDMILIFFYMKMNKILVLILIILGCILTGIYTFKFCLFLINKKLKIFKFIKNMNLNMFFSKIFFSMIFIMLIPNTFMSLIQLDLNNFIFNNFKLKFYLIIVMSLIFTKYILFYMNNMLFLFSSMLMILDMINLINNKINFILMKKIFYLLMIEEFIQFKMMNFLLNKNLKLSNFYISNMNLFFMVMMILLFMNFKILEK